MEFRKKPKAEGGSSSFVRNEWVTPPIPKHPQEWRPPGKEHRFEGRVPGESVSPYSIYGRQLYGLQCGNENIQLNTYAYVVRPDAPDLSEVLDSARVQEAMAELAANPNDRAAELAVNRVLATIGRPFFEITPPDPVSGVETSLIDHSSVGGERGFLAFLFVRDSAGIQHGNRMRQENHFTYLVAPGVQAQELFRSSASLREAVITGIKLSADGIVGEVSLSGHLDGALRGLISNLEDNGDRGLLIQPAPGGFYDVSGLDGTSAGWKCVRKSEVEVQVKKVDEPGVYHFPVDEPTDDDIVYVAEDEIHPKYVGWAEEPQRGPASREYPAPEIDEY